MTAATTGRCPTCKRTAIKDGNKLWPFCSERCHLVDLGAWLSEEYRIPEPTEAPGGGGGVDPLTPTSDDER